MTTADSPYLFYFASMLVIWLVYMLIRVRKHTRNHKLLKQVIKNNLTEPVSLHPVINTNRCIGCQACVYACPEREYGPVLGLIQGKAALIKASECIGHGACYASCPVDAITLVFGTARRGVEIPHVKPNFETNVPGILIAGELGGMGLVRNAFNQGRQAVESIDLMIQEQQIAAELDVLIVGAGPAGIAASLAAKEKGLKFETVEQDTLGGSILHYPRNKVVMDTAAALPMVGDLDLGVSTKQDFLQILERIIDNTGLRIKFKEQVKEVKAIHSNGLGFSVRTSKKTYSTKTVLLAIGRRGTPRQLGVPGEELAKVAYKLNDPEQFQGKQVLVVGGGDSALEAATSLAEQPDTRVTMSYRGTTFIRAREENRVKLAAQVEKGKVDIYYRSTIEKINENCVIIDHDDALTKIRNDAVFICTGGDMPISFLHHIGVNLETRYGTPL